MIFTLSTMVVNISPTHGEKGCAQFGRSRNELLVTELTSESRWQLRYAMEADFPRA
jgi:hypothetical protein